MKPLETSRKAATGRYSYTKVLDNSKRPVRGLWKRNGRFVARLAVEDAAGRKVTRWLPLAATTMPKATEEMRTIHVERKENRMRHVGMTPLIGISFDAPRLGLSQKLSGVESGKFNSAFKRSAIPR